MNILSVDAALPRAGVAVCAADGRILAKYFTPGQPGLIETLPGLLRDCITAAGIGIDAVAVTIGPGSFTGLRTAISLATGYAAAAGIPLFGVTVDEAFAMAFPLLQRPLWVCIRARRDKIFIIRDGEAHGFADDAIPFTRGPAAVAGNAANEVAARLAAGGGDVILTNARAIEPSWVAAAARVRLAAGLPAREALPVYVDPPETKLPAGGLRPAPV